MANEEQRRAFESYMGRVSGNNAQSQTQAQPVAQYPGSVAQPSNPYLYQQFPGIGAPPAAPTPPPAAPSTVTSYSGYQGGYPQGSYGHGMYGQTGIPQRPPPLGGAQSQQQGQQQTFGNYGAQPPPPLTGNNLRYNQADTMMSGGRSGPVTSTMVSPPHNDAQEIVESQSRQTSKNYYYHRNGQAQSAQAPSAEEVVVPVMLCHTCSHCGQMRSAGYHRNNPVVPGKPLILTPCRRCKKKLEGSHRSSSRYTRIRKCTADEPCDWPRESFRGGAGYDDRGRRRTREEAYVRGSSSSRPRVVRCQSSQAHLGVRALQQPLSDYRKECTVRTSSSSPRPRTSARYKDEVWPPPDIVRIQPTRADETYSVRPEPLPSRTANYDGVWPAPDFVRTQSYQDTQSRSLRRQSSRIIELSPSPPPSRSRPTRVVYRSESQERRPGSPSVSPVRVASHEERRSEEAHTRLMSHPRAFRRVIPEQRSSYRASDETISNADSMPRTRAESPSYSILKPRENTHETKFRRRASMRESEQSMHVEVGGPRVHFGSERRERILEPTQESEPRGRPRYTDDHMSTSKSSEHYRDYSRHRIQDEPPRAPQTKEEDYERIRVRRHSSISPQREYEDEIRIDRQRRISPSPPLVKRFEELRVRHPSSPMPPQHRLSRPAVSPPPPPPPPPSNRPLQRKHSFYRHVSRTEARGRDSGYGRSSTALSPTVRSRDDDNRDDHTDSGSAHSGGDDVMEVRTWKGVDERGRPVTFVEEEEEGGDDWWGE